jgi:hypothetical protein
LTEGREWEVVVRNNRKICGAAVHIRIILKRVNKNVLTWVSVGSSGG